MNFVSWILVFHVSSLPGTNAAHGGPATVQGFATQEQCETTGKRLMTSVKKIDWYQCVRADLPPVPVPTPRKAN